MISVLIYQSLRDFFRIRKPTSKANERAQALIGSNTPQRVKNKTKFVAKQFARCGLFTFLVLRSLSTNDFEHAKENKNDLRRKGIEVFAVFAYTGRRITDKFNYSNASELLSSHAFWHNPDLSQWERSWFNSISTRAGLDWFVVVNVGVCHVCNKSEFVYLQERIW